MAVAKKNNQLLELIINIVIPSLILMKLSAEQYLGTANALLLALAFPLGWGLYDLLRNRKTNFIAILGLVSILLTGGIGLLHLDAQWLAVKEAAIPGLIGIAVLASTRTRYPLIKTVLYTPAVIDVAKVQQHLEQRGNTRQFEARLLKATYLLSATFFFSSVMNYVLAKWIVTSPSGTEAFNEELGRMTLLSYPMIAIPSLVMMMAVLYYISRGMRELAGLSFTEALRQDLT
ncbi:MFS transporter [Vogesella sp. EB]|uniref:VC0807 family protein n=1 Tax=Vogesella sp. EB TaxID=1526735 RepID=UPI00064D3E60|nr:VC0807 family protein [Vogesella sp. EB]KMJ54203.1 MFS transporter [Vogesella sp. EB]